MERPQRLGVSGGAPLTRWLPWVIVAANVAGAAGFAQLVVTGLFPFSHHWIFPVMALALLVQTRMFPGGGPVAPFVACSLLLLGVAVARLETIILSHHLIHFAMAFGLGAALHRALSRWPSTPAWATANRRWAGLFLAVAVVAAFLAWRQEIWWGLDDGT